MKKNEKSKPEERMKGLLSYLRVNNFILNDTDFSEQVDIERTFVSAIKSDNNIYPPLTIPKDDILNITTPIELIVSSLLDGFYLNPLPRKAANR